MRNPVDGLTRYELDHLVAHLAEAGRAEDVHHLLRLEYLQSEGLEQQAEHPLNAWYAAKEAVADQAGFLTDISRALALAKAASNQQMQAGQPVAALGMEVRYLLLTASVNSLIANLPIELVTALVKNKIWSAERGLSNARNYLDPAQRANALILLLPFLTDQERKQALDEAVNAAQHVTSEHDQPRTLAAVAVHQSEPERSALLQQALQVARSVKDDSFGPRAMAEVAGFLPESERSQVLSEALDQADFGDFGSWTAQALRAIVSEVLSIALDRADFDEGAGGKAGVLRDLAPLLPESLLKKAFAMATRIEDESNRAEAMEGLAPYLTQELRQAALRDLRFYNEPRWQTYTLAAVEPYLISETEVLQNIQAGRYGEFRGHALAALSARLTSQNQAQVILLVEQIQGQTDRDFAWQSLAPHLLNAAEALQVIFSKVHNRFARAKALRTLAPRLNESSLQQAVQMITRIEGSEERSRMIAALILYLPASLLQEALEILRPIKDGIWRAIAVAQYLGYLEPTSRVKILVSTLSDVFAADELIYRGRGLGAIAPFLTEALWSQVIPGLQASQNDYPDMIFREIAPHIPAAAWLSFLQYATSLPDEDSRRLSLKTLAPYHPDPVAMLQYLRRNGVKSGEALAALASRLPDAYRKRVLQAILKLEDAQEQEQAFADLVPRLNVGLAREAFKALREKPLAKLLAALIPALPDDLLTSALRVAGKIKYDADRVEVLAALAPRLTEPERSKTIVTALDTTVRMDNALSRIEALRKVLPLIDLLKIQRKAAALRKARRSVQAIDPEAYGAFRARGLATIIPYLDDQEKMAVAKEALDLANKANPDSQVTILDQLAPVLPLDLLPPAYRLALQIPTLGQQINYQADALASVMPSMVNLPRERLFQIWRESTNPISANPRKDVCQALAALMPMLDRLGQGQACREVAQSIADAGQWWP